MRDGLLAVLGESASPAAFGLTVPVVKELPHYRRFAAKVARHRRAARRRDRRAPRRPGARRRARTSSRCWSRPSSTTARRCPTRELRDQLLTLLLAGHETTATALAWTFDLLLHTPPTLERLLDELESGDGAYLEAVIDESLRVRPVVPMTGRLLREPATLGGYELDAGTVVFAAIYMLHTNPEVYPDPFAFKPGALPRRRPGDLLLDPVRRRHAALHRRRLRGARAAGRPPRGPDLDQPRRGGPAAPAHGPPQRHPDAGGRHQGDRRARLALPAQAGPFAGPWRRGPGLGSKGVGGCALRDVRGHCALCLHGLLEPHLNHLYGGQCGSAGVRGRRRDGSVACTRRNQPHAPAPWPTPPSLPTRPAPPPTPTVSHGRARYLRGGRRRRSGRAARSAPARG